MLIQIFHSYPFLASFACRIFACRCTQDQADGLHDELEGVSHSVGLPTDNKLNICFYVQTTGNFYVDWHCLAISPSTSAGSYCDVMMSLT